MHYPRQQRREATSAHEIAELQSTMIPQVTLIATRTNPAARTSDRNPTMGTTTNAPHDNASAHARSPTWLFWEIQRTLLFWIIGLLNTALIRPEQIGSWRSWVGWTFIALASLDTIRLLWKGLGSPRRSGKGRAS